MPGTRASLSGREHSAEVEENQDCLASVVRAGLTLGQGSSEHASGIDEGAHSTERE